MSMFWKSCLSVFAALACTLPSFAAPVRNDDSQIGQQLNLPVYEWKDPDAVDKGLVVGIHGLTFYAAAYDSLAKRLASNGYRFYAADIRGFGRWKTEYQKYNGDDKVHFTVSKEDLVRIINKLRDDHPGLPVYLLGESLGANMAIWLIEDEPELVDGAILSAPCFKQCIHPKPRMAVDFVKGLTNPKKPLELTPYIKPYLSHDPEVTKNCLRDPNICRSLSPVDLIKSHLTNRAVFKGIERIPSDLPIFIVAGAKDQVFKADSIAPVVDKWGSKRTTLYILRDKGHLLLESQQIDPQIAVLIDDWLAKENGAALEKVAKRQASIREKASLK